MRRLEVTSRSFQHLGLIPSLHSCEGEDISPELEFKGAPEGTESYAIIVEDPDAPVGTFDHWLCWNLAKEPQKIGEGERPPVQGINHFGEYHYRGPCPPRGKPHRYFFKVFALDTRLALEEGSNKQELEAAMKGHIVAAGEMIGLYQR